MSADWKAGDRGICVDGSPGELKLPEGQDVDWVDDGFQVERGVIYLIHAVFPTPGGRLFLSVREKEAREEEGWSAHRFRKLVPACDRVAVEQEEKA